eukprot:15291392-Alexandrium_andersonii.AAC.1
MKGSLCLLSPPEHIFAAILGAARLVEAGATEDDLKLLRKAFLAADVQIEVVPNKEQQHWRAHAVRETIVEVGEVVKRTALQR